MRAAGTAMQDHKRGEITAAKVAGDSTPSEAVLPVDYAFFDGCNLQIWRDGADLRSGIIWPGGLIHAVESVSATV